MMLAGIDNRFFPAPRCNGNGFVVWWDGDIWRQEELSGVSPLSDIHANDTRYAVGEDGTIMKLQDFEWLSLTQGHTAYMQGVWAAGPADIFLGGGKLLHWNGSSFREFFTGTPENLNMLAT